MARTPRTGRRTASQQGRSGEDTARPATGPGNGTAAPGTTGRYLVLLDEGATDGGAAMLNRVAGVRATSSAALREGASAADLAASEGVMFPALGVAVVNAVPDQVRAMGAAAADSGILAIEPERIVHAIDEGGLLPSPPGFGAPTSVMPLEYLSGYRDAVNHLYDALHGDGRSRDSAELVPSFVEDGLTWGLQATKVPASRHTGRGIRVAVLDTGMDLDHPDFADRNIVAKSFIVGQSEQDGHGHGTHCIGTACGPLRPGQLPRYGVAYEAEIFAGKVLSNEGSGGDAGILAGIQWAIDNGCAIVSMSLGAGVEPGQAHSRIFEVAARRALARGTLIIAAAGNESGRPGSIAPVGHPANCPSIMAVAAIDRDFGIAPFSCGGLNGDGGKVDLAGPGVAVRSSWPRPTLHRTISGTSMATPHVAGIAALWAECDAQFRGRALMSILTQSARRLALPGRDVGAGLVQAP